MSRRYVLLATDGVMLYTHPWTDKIIFPGIISVHFRILGEEFRSSGGKARWRFFFFKRGVRGGWNRGQGSTVKRSEIFLNS